MYEKFYALDRQKQTRIIDSALEVFAEYGYKKCSIDEIVKKAEISKGIIFHYFQSKKNLFVFLFDYCIKVMTEDIEKGYDFRQRDFFERLINAQKIKLQTMKKHPKLFDFIFTAYFDKSKEVVEILSNSQTKALSYSSALLFDNVALERFKDGLDIEKVFKIIMWTSEGYIKEQSSVSIDNIKEISNGMNYYLDILKYNFYKGEYLL